MTLVDPSSQAAKEAAATFGIIITESEDCIKFTIQFVVGIRLRSWYTLVIRVLIILILPYPIRHPAARVSESREIGIL